MGIAFGDALDSQHQALIDALLPGLGYFGGDDTTRLSVNIQDEVDAIELAIEGPGPELINIGEIDFYDHDGNQIDRSELADNVKMSSVYGEKSNDDLLDDFIAGRLLHTHREPRPSILIRLKRKIVLSKIKISNRRDVYGRRSRFLSVRSLLGQKEINRYNNLTVTTAENKLSRLLNLVGCQANQFNSQEETARFCSEVRKKIIELVERDEFDLPVNDLVELIPIYDHAPKLNRFHITCCAHAVLRAWGNKHVLKTQFLQPLGGVLSSDFSVRKLQEELGRLSSVRESKSAEIVISRHDIHRAKLFEAKAQYLAAMDLIVSVLADHGITSMLGYGTLLGAVRDQGFMPHDDDVDLIVFVGPANQKQAMSERQKIIEILIKNGVQVPQTQFWHLQIIVSGIFIDLFPAWQEGNNWMLPMEQLKLRAVPAEHMQPVSDIELYGHRYPVPADSEAFLADRYGENWANPDPFYEWLWPIDRLETQLPLNLREVLERRKLIKRKHFGRLCRVASGQQVIIDKQALPMNSLPIISVARELGYDAIKLDVRISADGIVVLGKENELVGPDGNIKISTSSVNELQSFKLGTYLGEDVFVVTFRDALKSVESLDVQVNSRINPNDIFRLREAVDAAGFDPVRLQFCVNTIEYAQALLCYFPESVLLWKTDRVLAEHDEYFLDEAQALGVDGVMVPVSRKTEDYSHFMQNLRDRNLRVLMYMHSDDDADFERMRSVGVDYVTTLAHDSSTFQ